MWRGLFFSPSDPYWENWKNAYCFLITCLSDKLYASSVLQSASILYNFSHIFPPSWIILLPYLPFDLHLNGY